MPLATPYMYFNVLPQIYEPSEFKTVPATTCVICSSNVLVGLMENKRDDFELSNEAPVAAALSISLCNM
jgi:hypothetical protein